MMSLDGVSNLTELHSLVADLLDELGHDEDNLVMTYRKKDGAFGTVGKSTTIRELRSSTMLRLAPGSRPGPARRGKPRTNGRNGRYGGV